MTAAQSYLLVFVVAALATWAYLRWARLRLVLDVPGPRSAHQRECPTGGGLGPIVAIYFGFALTATATPIDSSAWAILIVATVLALVGAIDDRRGMSVWLRLVLQAAAVVALLCITGASGMPGFGLALVLLGLLWWINLFNFMDGIDGLAASEALFLSIAAASLAPDGAAVRYPLCLLAAACAGFLPFNWPPARLFMGDTGSLFFGIMIGAIALTTVLGGWLSPWVWLILAATFISDASLTLLRRAWRGESLIQAHNSHLYQVLARRWTDHQAVTVAFSLCNLLWLWPLAFAANYWPDFAPSLCVVAYLPLLAVWRCLADREPVHGENTA